MILLLNIVSSNPIDLIIFDLIASIVGTFPELNLGYVYVAAILCFDSPTSTLDDILSGSLAPVYIVLYREVATAVKNASHVFSPTEGGTGSSAAIFTFLQYYNMQ